MKKIKPFIIAEIGAKYGTIKEIIKLIKDIKKIGADAKISNLQSKISFNKNTLLPINKKIKQFSYFQNFS